jgi:hypothetical protein
MRESDEVEVLAYDTACCNGVTGFQYRGEGRRGRRFSNHGPFIIITGSRTTGKQAGLLGDTEIRYGVGTAIALPLLLRSKREATRLQLTIIITQADRVICGISNCQQDTVNSQLPNGKTQDREPQVSFSPAGMTRRC